MKLPVHTANVEVDYYATKQQTYRAKKETHAHDLDYEKHDSTEGGDYYHEEH